MGLAYLCVSDLHLGSPEGLLNDPIPLSDPPPRPTPALKNLAAGLRATVKAMHKSGDKRPTLILMGDVMELGLASYGDATEAVALFFAELFPEGEEPCFAPEIVYIPGNHDHHLWRMTQDRAFLNQLAAHKGKRPPHDIPVATRLLEKPHLESELLTTIVRAQPGLEKFTCQIVYPNWGIASEDGSRAVVFHHGHYIDTMYLALSQFREFMEDGLSLPATAGELERNNGSWIDFLWSDLGSAGNIATGAETLYEIMMDGAASHRFAQSMSKHLARSFSAITGTSARAPLAVGKTDFGLNPGKLISAAFDAGIGQFAQGQREAWRTVMSDDEIDTLRWYLEGPITNQFRYPQFDDDGKLAKAIASKTVHPEMLPESLTFVFGHTHKPFQDLLPLARFPMPAQIYNTGGWEFRGSAPMPCHGGSAVLVDDDLNVAALRLYSDPIHNVVPPVHVQGTGYDTAATNPLLAAAADAVAAAGSEWAAFTKSIHDAIAISIYHRVRDQIPAEETPNPHKEKAA